MHDCAFLSSLRCFKSPEFEQQLGLRPGHAHIRIFLFFFNHAVLAHVPAPRLRANLVTYLAFLFSSRENRVVVLRMHS